MNEPRLRAAACQAAYEAQYPNCNWLHADIDGDDDVDLDDLDVFVNLLSSGNAALWAAHVWDAENRLVGVEPGGPPKSGDVKVGFVYDYMGRRVQKKVWTHNGSSWGNPTEHRKFVWNGWLLLMELDGLNDDAVLRKRTWGLDLSGLTGGGSSAGLASSRSMLEGAGGIGGLLAVYDTNGTTTGESPGADDMAYVYFYDANGNVGQVVDLSHTPGDPAGAILARYEYDPYGNVTSQSGAYASANPFRFSTKYWDDETGLGYWGYRYYDPKLGRWVSRDPIGELGGDHLYTFALNSSISSIDAFGEVCCSAHSDYATLSLGSFSSEIGSLLGCFASRSEVMHYGGLALQVAPPPTPPQPDQEMRDRCGATRRKLIELIKSGQGIIGTLWQCALKQGCILPDPEHAIKCVYNCDGIVQGTYYERGIIHLCGNNFSRADQVEGKGWEILVHELVHAAQCKRTFDKDDKCMDAMINEARAYWRSGEAKTCERACERAWNSARAHCYRALVQRKPAVANTGGQKTEPEMTREEFERKYRKVYIDRCKALCGSGDLKHRDVIDEECDQILK